MMRKIKRNMVQCKHCGETIESKSVHDFKQCRCGSCAVDGGHEYLRREWKNSQQEDYIELSEWDS